MGQLRPSNTEQSHFPMEGMRTFLILEGNNVSPIEILQGVVQNPEANTAQGDYGTIETGLEKSEGISYVQDRCRCTYEAKWVHCRMEASVSRCAFLGRSGNSNRCTLDVYQAILQSRHGSVAHGTSSGGIAATMGICTRVLLFAQRQNISHSRFRFGSGSEK